jgi:FAD:protein FMN transferase
MMLSRRRLLTITAGVALGASMTPARARTVSWRGVAMGAEAKIVIADLPERDAHHMIGLARAEIERLENIFSLYRSDSVIARLNEIGRIAAPPQEMLVLMSQVDAIHAGTVGMLDPTIQPLWATYARHGGEPPVPELKAGLALVGWKNVGFDSGAVQLNRAGMQLTLNGIAQGFVTDRVVRLLRREGLKNAVVNVGEIAALGHNETGGPWEVGIATHGDGMAEEFVELSNKAIATSAPTGTVFSDNAGHLLDPRSGRPAAALWKWISVIHPTATIADGLSTAFALMRWDEIQMALKHFPDSEVIAHDGNAVTRFYG